MNRSDTTTPSFNLIGGKAVADILNSPTDIISVVRQAYLDHEAGRTHNPDSYFLRFSDEPHNRIIALPATLNGPSGVSGIKWISSFPGNVARGIQRASAVLILNDPQTGYPFAVLEASRISSTRTAASAVLGAYWLNSQSREAARICFIGGGIIARAILRTFLSDGWQPNQVGIYDPDRATAKDFIELAREALGANAIEVDLPTALEADVVVFATTAPEPHISGHAFRPAQVILNISLRDIAPSIIATSANVLDDVEHCLKANTSPDLAVREFGHRDFINGTLAQLIVGEISLDRHKPLIFSPFGLGVLDLAVGRYVYDEACRRGTAQKVDNFFFDIGR